MWSSILFPWVTQPFRDVTERPSDAGGPCNTSKIFNITYTPTHTHTPPTHTHKHTQLSILSARKEARNDVINHSPSELNRRTFHTGLSALRHHPAIVLTL